MDATLLGQWSPPYTYPNPFIFIFNKNEGNNQKVENKVSGRVLHYVKIAGCSAMYTNVTCCK